MLHTLSLFGFLGFIKSAILVVGYIQSSNLFPEPLTQAEEALYLKQLKEGKSISKPTYDYTQHTRSDVVETITPRDVYILEGLFVLYDEKIRDLCDILVFVDTDADIRFIRRLKRDIEERGRSIDSVCNQYLETVRPMHEQFVEPSKKYAHIIIPEGGNNTVAIDLLITKISSVIDAKE